jgi:hypothetical protein
MRDNRDYPPNPNAPFNEKYHLERGRDILKFGLLNGTPEKEYLREYHSVLSEATELSHEVIRCRAYREVAELTLILKEVL